jgi:hypothetical protein
VRSKWRFKNIFLPATNLRAKQKKKKFCGNKNWEEQQENEENKKQSLHIYWNSDWSRFFVHNHNSFLNKLDGKWGFYASFGSALLTEGERETEMMARYNNVDWSDKKIVIFSINYFAQATSYNNNNDNKDYQSKRCCGNDDDDNGSRGGGTTHIRLNESSMDINLGKLFIFSTVKQFAAGRKSLRTSRFR